MFRVDSITFLLPYFNKWIQGSWGAFERLTNLLKKLLIWLKLAVCQKKHKEGSKEMRWNFLRVSRFSLLLLVTRYFLLVTRNVLLVNSYILLITCYVLLVTLYFLVVIRYFLLFTAVVYFFLGWMWKFPSGLLIIYYSFLLLVIF